MRPSSLILLAILAAAPLTPAGDRQAHAATQGAPDRSHAGQPAPALVFLDRAGGKHRIADFAGHPVLVNLWATWCAPCKAEMPALDRFAARALGKPMVIALSEDAGAWHAIDGFFTPGRFKTLTPYSDKGSDYALAIRAAGLPVSVLYDAGGREVWRVAGPLEWDQRKPDTLAR